MLATTASRHDFQSALASRTRSSDVVFGMKLALYLTLILSSGWVALSSHWALATLGILGLGLMFAHGVELQHQVLHQLGFRNRRLNETVGVLLGLPMLVSYASYQASHLRHHRLLGTPENKEYFDYGDQYGGDQQNAPLRTWLRRFSMVEHYGQFALVAWRTLRRLDFPGETARVSRRIRRDHLAMLGMIVLYGATSVLVGEAIILRLWLLPLLFVAGPIHALIELPEHYRCDTAMTDVFANTRTIRSNAFMTWFTNCNNYHVEHHLMPGLPIERLPDLHEVIAPRIKHLEHTYLDFFRHVLTRRAASATGTP